MTVPGKPATKVGRPRSTQMHAVVCDAVISLIGDGATLSSLSLVDIAQETGVSRNSIYRRWESKERLYLDVVRSMRRRLPELSEQSARENLIGLFTMTRDRDGTRREQRMEQAIANDALIFSDLHELYLIEIVAPFESAVKMAIRRGKETGEIRSDIDESLLCDALVACAYALRSSDQSPDIESRSRQMVELVFDGVAPI